MILYGKDLGTDPPLLVADCWSTSEGSLDTAGDLIQHINPYVDVVKFTGYTDHRFDLKDKGLSVLYNHTQDVGVGFMLTPVQVGWVRNAAQWGDAIKIASGDLLHRELIEAAAATGKPLILSTGWATEDEVWQVIEQLDHDIGKHVWLQVVSAYPTPVAQAGIGAMTDIPWRWFGYSNHVAPLQGGFEACCAAVALGASIIEVHATLDRSESACARFHDHQVSFLPDELRDLRQRLDKTHACLGSGVKEPQPCELANIKARRWG